MTRQSTALDLASPHFRVFVAGRGDLAELGVIDRVSVSLKSDMGTDAHASCEIGIINWDGTLTNYLGFREEILIEVEMGYPDTLMRRMGSFILTEPEFVFPQEGPPRINLKCVDEAVHVATKTTTPRAVEGSNLEALIRQIIDSLEWGPERRRGRDVRPEFEFDIEELPVGTKGVSHQIPAGSNAWIELRILARNLGYFVWFDNYPLDSKTQQLSTNPIKKTVIHFRRPSSIPRLGVDILELKQIEDQTLELFYHQGPGSNVKRVRFFPGKNDGFKNNPNYKQADIGDDGNVEVLQSVIAEITTVSGSRYDVIENEIEGAKKATKYTRPLLNAGNAIEQGKLNDRALEGVWATHSEVDIIGDPRFIPGTYYRIRNVGRFAQFWWVTEAEHTIDSEGYSTTIRSEANSRGSFEDSLANIRGEPPRPDNSPRVIGRYTGSSGSFAEIVENTE